MRAVRLIRAGWWDDEVNGDPGRPLWLSDDKAESHVVAGNALYDPVLQAEMDGTPSPQTTFVGADAAAKRLTELTEAGKRDEAMQQLVELTEELGLYDTVPEPAPEPAEPAMKRPYGNMSKATWIEWAVHNGADPAWAAAQTKNELQSLYGERL